MVSCDAGYDGGVTQSFVLKVNNNTSSNKFYFGHDLNLFLSLTLQEAASGMHPEFWNFEIGF